MANQYEVAVLGGGPGGYVAAIACAQFGLKTVLIEKDALGGTCLNRGCIPTKALLHAAELYRDAKESAEFGIFAKDVTYDYEKVTARKDRVINTLKRGVEGLVRGNKVTLVRGAGKFTNANTIEVTGAQPQTLTFDRAIIATGSYPAKLPIAGMDLPGVINSDGFLNLTKLPASAVIIGGGVIGIEFASIMNAFGCDVSIVEMMPEILPGMDKDICSKMRGILQKKGVRFHLGARVAKIVRKDGCLAANFSHDGQTLTETGEIVIVSTGRRPVTQDVGFENLGLEMERGFIAVDEYCRTNVPNIYAIGDVNGRVMLAHAASAQGMAVAKSCKCGKPVKADFALVPACVYTTPEIACIGLTEEKAAAAGYKIKTGRFDAAGNGKSLVLGEREGFVKIVTDETTGEILGMQLFTAHATDMIGEGLAAMKLESTVEELSDAIHPHPTVNEMIMEAAHMVTGNCVHSIKR